MTDNRRYIDTEPGWQFSLGDLFLLAPLVGIGCLAALKFAHPSNPDDIFIAALFVLPFLFGELLATFVAGRWILHSLRWLKQRGASQSHFQLLALIIGTCWAAGVLAMFEAICWFVWVACSSFIADVVYDYFRSGVVAGVILVSLLLPGVVFLRRIFLDAWRHARPRVWVPAESPAHDG